MRLVLIALLLIPVSYALLVENTDKSGENLVLYGDAIVYERGGNIFVFDISKNEERDLGRGRNPSLFGFTVAFEAEEEGKPVIQYGNVQDKKIVSTGAVGRHPYIFSSFIVFSTKESELGVDFSNDGDLDDDIIRQYDIDSKELINLKAVGDFPALNQRSLLFVTEEKQIDVDLNADGDKDDKILRVFDKEKRQVANAEVVADKPVLFKSGKAVFTSDGKITIFDAVEQKALKTEIVGSSPTIFSNVVVFERDGNLFGFSLNSMKLAKISLVGSSPSLFEKRLAFVSSEKDLGDLNNNGRFDELIIRYAEEEDVDGDDVFDFVDNCAAVINSEQDDSNSDGVGDACEVQKSESKKAEDVSTESSEEEVKVSPPANMTVTESERKGIAWYWYLLIVLLLPFACYYGYRYYKKRQKSFGF